MQYIIMKKYNHILKIIQAVVLIFAFVSCAEDVDTSTNSDGVFNFTAGNQVYTRADEGDSSFPNGTKYQIFAIENNNWNTNYLWKEATTGDAMVGTEQDGVIDYEGNNRFNKRTLSFYAITGDNEKELTIQTNGKSAPVCEVIPPLPDIMFASLPNQTYQNSGKLKLSFKHTLSKLHFFVLKNKDLKDEVKLEKIEIIDYQKGTLSLATGEYTDDVSQRNGNAYEVYKNSLIVNENKKDLETVAYVFPTRGKDSEKHGLKLKVTTTLKGTSKETEYTLKQPITDSSNSGLIEKSEAFQLKANHEYDVALTITGEALVITVLPRVYDWIDNNIDVVDTEVYGHVTFGGITWMDRNLGATSGDPTASMAEWEKSRGFYYQFGRSIPYYLEGSVLDPKATVDNAIGVPKPNCSGATKGSCAKPLPYIRTADGNICRDSQRKDTSNKGYDDCAQYPGDGKNYAFAFTVADVGNTKWRDWAKESSTSGNYWSSYDRQPCPKGWRLPTEEEFLSIMPINNKLIGDGSSNIYEAGNITFYGKEDSTTYFCNVTNDYNKEKAQYVGIRKSKDDNIGIIYGVKRQTKDQAYRLKWEIKSVGGEQCDTEHRYGGLRNVLVISRYPADSNTSIAPEKATDEAKEKAVNQYDWEHPLETLVLPIPGYIHADGNGAANIYAGSEAVYMTGTTSRDRCYYSVRIKISGSIYNRGISTYDIERRGYGCSIRCVRDKSLQ